MRIKKNGARPFFFVAHQEKRENILRKYKRTPQKTTEKMAPTQERISPARRRLPQFPFFVDIWDKTMPKKPDNPAGVAAYKVVL